MPEIVAFAVIGLIVGLISLSVWYESSRRKQRQELMNQAASSLGLEYQLAHPVEFDSRWPKYRLLTNGRNRSSSNFILASTNELNLIVFDHEYTTGGGKNKHRRRQTVALVTSPQLQQPEFSIIPENWLSRLSDLFTRTDIDFDDDTEFSKRFLVSGPDAESIRVFLSPSRRLALMNCDLPSMECFPGELIFYRPGKLVEPSQLKSLMNEVFEIYKAFSNA